MVVKRFFTKAFNQYEDSQEEQEYTQIKFPLIRDFVIVNLFLNLFLSFTIDHFCSINLDPHSLYSSLLQQRGISPKLYIHCHGCFCLLCFLNQEKI